MSISYSKMKPLFLQQSYMDAWEDYRRALRKRSFPCWDYVILTASNEDQAAAYRKEIEYSRMRFCRGRRNMWYFPIRMESVSGAAGLL